MEGIWMLSGSDNGNWLNQFVGDFTTRFAEPGGIIHGAYGKRWRAWFPVWGKDETAGSYVDQLTKIVKILRKNPEDRRAVIQMWDTSVDLGTNFKDVPCNTQIYPRVREGSLDLTIMCRSNDIIWGAYGANAVHFSMLHEYLAAGVGCRVGTMFQLSNNFHGYVDVLEKHPAPRIHVPHNVAEFAATIVGPLRGNPYEVVYPMPMVGDFDAFDDDVGKFLSDVWGTSSYVNQWFMSVAWPMRQAHRLWKIKQFSGARSMLMNVDAPDWRRAAQEWMDRRTKV
jgi:hypothetical protein